MRPRWMMSALVCFSLVLPTLSASGATPKRVLIVHSFGNAAPPFTTHSLAFETELTAKMGEPVDLDEVSLDVARYASLDMEEALVDFMRARQAKWQPDLVVPVGSPAGVFVAQHRDRLFPASTPIVYAGMDKGRLPPGALDQNAAFVGESFDVPGWVEDILQIAPDTRNIAVLIGDSPLERLWTDILKKKFEPFAGRVSFTWLNELSLDGIMQRTKNLPPHSFILHVLMMRDGSGVTHDGDQVLRQVHAVANAPINGIFQHQLGFGITGGRLYQAEAEGVEAARIAIRILRGEPASLFEPMIIGPLPPRYDWRELQKWNIDEKLLPKGSTILFRTPTLWEKNRVFIFWSVTVILFQTALITALIANLLRRRRAERSLSESEARVALAAEAAHLGVWDLNTKTSEMWVSDKVRELFGLDGTAPIDRTTFEKRVHPEDRAMREAAIDRAIQGQGEYNVEYRIVLPDKTVRWIHGRGRRMNEAEGKPTRVLGVAMDITARKHAEKEAMEQRDELAHLARVATLGELSGSLAHELNQPLAIVLSNAQAAQRMLAQESPDLAELREILADIVSEDRRAGEVITRLRALLKRGETRLRPLALNEVIEEVVRLLRSDLVARGVTIQTALADGLPDVPGDQVQLQQVLLNLIINGCDAMAENPPPERVLTISTSLRDSKVCMSVVDRGCGLPDGDADRIFQPFVTTKSHGLGIGLSICRSIIVAHHGRLWAEPNAGRGTTLHMELPIAEPAAS